MNKGEFIKAFAEAAQLTNKDAAEVYEAFVEVITTALKEGKKVSLLGFGNFELKKKAARTGINPQTKEVVQIAAANAPAFKASKVWKALFN